MTSMAIIKRREKREADLAKNVANVTQAELQESKDVAGLQKSEYHQLLSKKQRENVVDNMLRSAETNKITKTIGAKNKELIDYLETQGATAKELNKYMHEMLDKSKTEPDVEDITPDLRNPNRIPTTEIESDAKKAGVKLIKKLPKFFAIAIDKYDESEEGINNPRHLGFLKQLDDTGRINFYNMIRRDFKDDHQSIRNEGIARVFISTWLDIFYEELDKQRAQRAQQQQPQQQQPPQPAIQAAASRPVQPAIQATAARPPAQQPRPPPARKMGSGVRVFQTFPDIFKRLNVIIGIYNAGNKSVRDEIIGIADFIFNKKKMSKDTHQQIMKIVS